MEIFSDLIKTSETVTPCSQCSSQKLLCTPSKKQLLWSMKNLYVGSIRCGDFFTVIIRFSIYQFWHKTTLLFIKIFYFYYTFYLISIMLLTYITCWYRLILVTILFWTLNKVIIMKSLLKFIYTFIIIFI